MEEKKMNEKESLELISQMIQNTQQRIRNHNGIPFLVWGYLSVLVSLAVWYLLRATMDYRWNYLWFLIPVLGYPIMMFFLKKEEKGLKTYIDKVISYIWISLGIASLVVTVSSIFFWRLPIFFIILLLVGAGTTMTALIARFRLMVFLGFTCLFSSVLCLVIKNVNVILVFAFIFLIMMIIPGHILNFRNKQSNV
ncbi:MAG: hypothetical protein QM751_02165 [Paludibacteraceae bacterium]